MRFGENINYLWKMKELILIILLFCSAFSVKAQNLVLNGSFELNNYTNCYNDINDDFEYNTKIHYSTNFGDDYTTSLFKLPCWACSPPVLWGGMAKEGDWALILIGQDETHILPPPLDTIHIIKQGKISLELDAPLLSTKRYKLSFWIKDPPPEPNCMYTKNNYINVGISNYEDSLGKHLITSIYGDTAWKEYTYVFETQNAEEYLTVTVGLNGIIDYAVFIDHFVLTETQEPLTTGINEISQEEKKLLKIVDILGRESKSKNGLLFYIYSDGTVEKKIIIE
jgi:hypothetical protein